MTECDNVASDGSAANQSPFGSSISGDGRFVMFNSYATNVVPGDTNEAADVFVRDRLTGVTERVSVSSDAAQAAFGSSVSAGGISKDGRFVAFISRAVNLTPD